VTRPDPGQDAAATRMTDVSAAAAVSTIEARLASARAVLDDAVASECVQRAAELAERLVVALRNGNKAVFFGNGGSAMDAGHLAAELMGRFYFNRPPLAAVCLSDHTAGMTAIANDYSYDEVFVRQLAGVGLPGDVVVGLTTSGTSPNVVRALEWARDNGLVTAALTGATGGKVRDLVDICVAVPSTDTPRVQEACMHLGHSICEYVEQTLFGEEYGR
jgi:D-sedoheptulose 7-phosphate isomerase